MGAERRTTQNDKQGNRGSEAWHRTHGGRLTSDLNVLDRTRLREYGDAVEGGICDAWQKHRRAISGKQGRGAGGREAGHGRHGAIRLGTRGRNRKEATHLPSPRWNEGAGVAVHRTITGKKRVRGERGTGGGRAGRSRRQQQRSLRHGLVCHGVHQRKRRQLCPLPPRR